MTTVTTEFLQKYNLNQLGSQASLYLYGHETMIDLDKKNIGMTTIKYIKDSQRFST